VLALAAFAVLQRFKAPLLVVVMASALLGLLKSHLG
jgi:hypothetical protein